MARLHLQTNWLWLSMAAFGLMVAGECFTKLTEMILLKDFYKLSNGFKFDLARLLIHGCLHNKTQLNIIFCYRYFFSPYETYIATLQSSYIAGFPPY
jgi:hypothetical protein